MKPFFLTKLEVITLYTPGCGSKRTGGAKSHFINSRNAVGGLGEAGLSDVIHYWIKFRLLY